MIRIMHIEISVSTYLCSAVLLLECEARADLIYSNGGLATGPMTESGEMAPDGEWSELQHDTGNLMEANYSFGAGAIQGETRLGDDFTIPSDRAWTIRSIDTYFFKIGAPSTPSPFVGCTMQIWNGIPDGPDSRVIAGDATTNRLTDSVNTKLYRIPNTVVPPPGGDADLTRIIWRNTVTFYPPVILPEGTYWIDWACTNSAGTDHFVPKVTVPGARAQPGWNAMQLTGSRHWILNEDDGSPFSAPDVPQDFPFDIHGSTCGDGIISPPETCEDGNIIDGDGCDSNCTTTACGNGVVTGTEECDDGNAIPADGCSSTCEIDEKSCGCGPVGSSRTGLPAVLLLMTGSVLGPVRRHRSGRLAQSGKSHGH